jgi:L-alanine-DL-glutamate epimerase-like enolase superfamily enzyme
MGYEIHYSGNALCDLAGVHVAMAITNCQFLESLYPDPVHGTGAANAVEIDGAGLVHAPGGSGLGATVDTDYIQAHRLGVLS